MSIERVANIVFASGNAARMKMKAPERAAQRPRNALLKSNNSAGEQLVKTSLAFCLMGLSIGLCNPVCATIINLGSSQDTSIANNIAFPEGGLSEFMINWENATSSLGLIQFDLSAIPSGATINIATLTLFHEHNVQPGITLNFLRNTSVWDENTTTYATRPTTAGGPVSSLTIADSNNGVFRSWDFTAITQSWVNGVVNDGLTLERDPDEPVWPYFMSKEASDEAQRPLLTINFSVSSQVPEPATLALLGLAFAGVGLARRRNRH